MDLIGEAEAAGASLPPPPTTAAAASAGGAELAPVRAGLWWASAFKGAIGVDATLPDVRHYMHNQLAVRSLTDSCTL